MAEIVVHGSASFSERGPLPNTRFLHRVDAPAGESSQSPAASGRRTLAGPRVTPIIYDLSTILGFGKIFKRQDISAFGDFFDDGIRAIDSPERL
ncbi:MAG: hypothetical protein PHF93_02435 [Acidobacteriota bacterium]|jgi:hypothetical protein|nr:hypothetical protein [Acidobacteriota bacterium]HNQ81318.1 hypothetical protein [Candidatus Aminicenantes bacterium]MDD8032653.1 hypothetical protein [Acidobacteriota bacterium]MDD8039749.1 hypothetical protein [Acidobacteriota bacterium]MDW3225961.1 hypothetical protein [Acidobacteriota bacterium]